MTPSADETAPTSPSPPDGFGRLARRMRDWTTNLLFTAIVLVVGLSLGRQLIEWWRADPEAMVHAPAPMGPGDEFDAGTLDLGDMPYTLETYGFKGRKELARAELLERCRRIVAVEATLGESSDGERKLLELVARRQPLESGEGGAWELFELEEPLPIIVGVRKLPEKASTGEDSSTPSRRVLVWGTVIQNGESAWNLYTFQSRTVADRQAAGTHDVPLPSGSRRLMSLTSASGSSWLAFQTAESCDRSQSFFAERLTLTGASSVAWSQLDKNWQGVGTWRGAKDRLFIRLAPDGRGGCTGLVVLEPAK